MEEKGFHLRKLPQTLETFIYSRARDARQWWLLLLLRFVQRTANFANLSLLVSLFWVSGISSNTGLK